MREATPSTMGIGNPGRGLLLRRKRVRVITDPTLVRKPEIKKPSNPN